MSSFGSRAALVSAFGDEQLAQNGKTFQKEERQNLSLDLSDMYGENIILTCFICGKT